MLGTLPVTDGKIAIAGKNISDFTTKALANMIAYIPQYHSPVFAYTVLDIVIMGRASHFSAFETPKEPDPEAAFCCIGKSKCTASCQQEIYILKRRTAAIGFNCPCNLSVCKNLYHG